MPMSLSPIPELLAELRAGRMIVLMDDEDRENEGDLIMAAACVRPEDINFMARYGRGLICLALTRERCERLRLPLMVNDTYARQSTNFTVSIEAARGVTTGISAADRATTVRMAVHPEACAEDLVQPGHIFPLMAQAGGVLTRAGHTEASMDLARLAGFEPAAVLVEVLNDDGSMARRPDLERFAGEHGLKLGTIADLIHYRLRHESTVARLASCPLDTEFGPFTLHLYGDHLPDEPPHAAGLQRAPLHMAPLHMALVRGTPDPAQPLLVRVHLLDPLVDVFGARLPDSGWPLPAALRRIARDPAGVLLLLGQPQNTPALIRHMHALSRGESRPGGHAGADSDLRSYGIGAQILADLGVRRMRVLSAPKRLHALSGFGLEIVEYVHDEPN